MKRKIIDNQQILNYPFGLLGTVSKNGCGMVAVYNTLVLKGKPVPINKILKCFKFVYLGGIFGCHFPRILITLWRFGIKCLPTTKRKADREKREGDVVIAKICRHTKNPLMMHYVVCCFSDGLWHIYNPLSPKLPKTSRTLKEMFFKVTTLGLWKAYN